MGCYAHLARFEEFLAPGEPAGKGLDEALGVAVGLRPVRADDWALRLAMSIRSYKLARNHGILIECVCRAEAVIAVGDNQLATVSVPTQQERR